MALTFTIIVHVQKLFFDQTQEDKYSSVDLNVPSTQDIHEDGRNGLDDAAVLEKPERLADSVETETVTGCDRVRPPALEHGCDRVEPLADAVDKEVKDGPVKVRPPGHADEKVVEDGPVKVRPPADAVEKQIVSGFV